MTDRSNTKTCEELSLSMDSTNVAVAEVNLVDAERAKERRLAELQREEEQSNATTNTNTTANNNASSSSTVSEGEGGVAAITAAVTAAMQPQLNLLSASVLQMDTRLQAVESNVATIMQQQEMIIKLLIQQSNAKINDAV
jgi:hypothetical protein